MKIDQLQDGATFGEQRGKINQALKSVETDSTITGDGDSSPLSVVAENIKATSTDQSLVLAPDGVGGVEFRAEQGGGGTGDHTQLTNRSAADQHPISAITGLQTALDDKVDKVAGKGLSTEDYTTAEKTKLSNIEDNAQVNPTDSEIKTAYESNADTNAYTDAEKTKVGAIVTNGTGDNYLSDDGTYKAIQQGEIKPDLVERPRTGVTEVIDMNLNQTTQINFNNETAIDIQVTPPSDTLTKQTTRRVILNNVVNPNAVNSITFNDNGGTVFYMFGDGDPINSLAIGAQAVIELSNVGNNLIYVETKPAIIV